LKAENYVLVIVKRINYEKFLQVGIQKRFESREKEKTVCRGEKEKKPIPKTSQRRDY